MQAINQNQPQMFYAKDFPFLSMVPALNCQTRKHGNSHIFAIQYCGEEPVLLCPKDVREVKTEFIHLSEIELLIKTYVYDYNYLIFMQQTQGINDVSGQVPELINILSNYRLEKFTKAKLLQFMKDLFPFLSFHEGKWTIVESNQNNNLLRVFQTNISTIFCYFQTLEDLSNGEWLLDLIAQYLRKRKLNFNLQHMKENLQNFISFINNTKPTLNEKYNNLPSFLHGLLNWIALVDSDDFSHHNLSLPQNYFQLSQLCQQNVSRIRLQGHLFLLLLLSRFGEEFQICGSNAAYLLNLMSFSFSEKDLSYIRLANINLSGCEFLRADLRNSIFTNVDISGGNFVQADMKNADWKQLKCLEQSRLESISEITDLKCSDDGQLIAILTEENIFQVWKTFSNQLVLTKVFQDLSYYGLEFSKCSKLLFHGTMSGRVMIWNIRNGGLYRALDNNFSQQNPITVMKLSPNGKLLGVGLIFNRSVQIWNFLIGQRIRDFQYDQQITQIRFLDQKLLLNDISNNIFCQDIMNQSMQKKIYTSSKSELVVISPSGLLAAISQEHLQKIQILYISNKLSDRQIELQGQQHYGSVQNMSISHSEQFMLLLTHRQILFLCDIVKGVILFNYGYVDCELIHFFPDTKSFIVTHSSQINIWKMGCLNLKNKQYYEALHINAVDISFSKQRMIVGLTDSSILVWDISNWRQVHLLREHNRGVYGLAYSPCSQYFASAGSEKLCIIWDSVLYNKILAIDLNQNPNCIVFSPDSSLLATCGDCNLIKVWSRATGQLIKSFGGHLNFLIGKVVFSACGLYIFSQGNDNFIRYWDISAGICLYRFEFKMNTKFSFCQSKSTIAFLNQGNGVVILTEMGGKKNKQSVPIICNYIHCFSKLGKLLVTSTNNVIQLWDCDKWSVYQQMQFPECLLYCKFSDDDKSIIFLSEKGSFYIFKQSSPAQKNVTEKQISLEKYELVKVCGQNHKLILGFDGQQDEITKILHSNKLRYFGKQSV